MESDQYRIGALRGISLSWFSGEKIRRVCQGADNRVGRASRGFAATVRAVLDILGPTTARRLPAGQYTVSLNRESS